MQLVTSVYAPSSVWNQQMPVALLNTSPSGLEKSWSAVSDERFTAPGAALDSAPNRYTSHVKVVEAAPTAPSFIRRMWPLGLPACAAEAPRMSV